MKYKLIFLLALAILVLPMASAQSQDIIFTFEADTEIDIKIPCFDNGTFCASSTQCNASITYPNQSILIDNIAMTNQVSFHNVTLNTTQTSKSGEYFTWIVCTDAAISGEETFFFEINPTGIRPTDQRTGIIVLAVVFMFILGIIMFVVYIFHRSDPVKWTFFIIGVTFFLIAINVIFVSLQDAVVNSRLEGFFDFFVAISFYFYWFAAGLIFIIWMLTFLHTWLYKQNLRTAAKFGGANFEGKGF